MMVRAENLFVFVGAGASLSMPAGLPVFDWLRDDVLRQLRLSQYVPGARSDHDPLTEVAAGLVPEPFMLELSRSGIDVQAWLSRVLLRGRPNAAHHALAQLAAHGARVWTVNFDTLIEQASGQALGAIAWPQDPAAGAPVMKPHGSAGGSLIVTAAQVLVGVDERWLARLRADVRGRLAVFLGYRGRDLDFQPVWDEILDAASGVIWFERQVDGRPAEEDHKRLLLRRVNQRGDLRFPPPAPFPPGTPATALPNPSWDFVAWCLDNGLADVPPALARQLFREVPDIDYPPLPGDREWARPAVQGLLGDYPGARRSYLRLGLRPGYQRRAAAALTTLEVNQGGTGIAALLGAAALLPRRGRLGALSEVARRKQITVWHRTGRHDQVLRATGRLPDGAVSTYLILRASALNRMGSLDQAAQTADAARRQALKEEHPVRAAHAAFQQCLALLWAERVTEADRCLTDYLSPYAALAASRWVAWAGFIGGGLAVRRHDPAEAHARFAAATTRFQAEALLDGVVSVKIAGLAAMRLSGDGARYLQEADHVMRLSRHGSRGLRYYTRNNAFTAEAIDIDRAEYARASQHDLSAAWTLYTRAASSRYPLHAGLGHLGLALIETERGQPSRHAEIATRIASRTRCRLVAQRARELTAAPTGTDPLREILFC